MLFGGLGVLFLVLVYIDSINTSEGNHLPDFNLHSRVLVHYERFWMVRLVFLLHLEHIPFCDVVQQRS